MKPKCMGMRGESYLREGLRMFGDLRYPCYTAKEHGVHMC